MSHDCDFNDFDFEEINENEMEEKDECEEKEKYQFETIDDNYDAEFECHLENKLLHCDAATVENQDVNKSAIFTASAAENHLIKEELLTPKIEYDGDDVKLQLTDSENLCSICQKTFTTKRSLTTHIKTVHEKNFMCEMCTKAFGRKSDMLAHMRVHTNEKSFVCDECGKSFYRKTELRRHNQSHDGKGDSEGNLPDPKNKKMEACNQTENQCGICFKTFVTRSSMICHIRDIHEQSGDYGCSFCEKKFHKKSSRIDHERRHTGEKPFVCVECGKCFETKSYLNFHSQLHSERQGCNICQKTFSLKKSLLKHIKFVHEKIKDYGCESCAKMFARKEHLKRHVEDVHGDNGDKLNKCDQCDKSYKGEQSLKVHIKFVHENERNFLCEICNRKYPTKQSLERHIVDIHELSGRFECGFCERKYLKKWSLIVHERCHTKEKPFKCGFCEKSFHHDSDKILHERTKHTGEEVFKCKTCYRRFVSHERQLMHMDTHVKVSNLISENLHPSILEPDPLKPDVSNPLMNILGEGI